MLEKRYQDMITSQQDLEGEILRFRYDNDAINKSSFGLLDKRLSKNTVRSYFTQKVYSYIRECAINENIRLKKHSWDTFYRKLPYIVEGIMTILYHDNQIWDKKNCLNRNQEIDASMGGRLLRSALLEYAYQEFEEEWKCDVMYKLIEKSIHYVEAGQYIDKFGNNYDCFERILSESNKIGNEKILVNKEISSFIDLDFTRSLWSNEKILYDKKDFVDLYFKRLYLVGASLFKNIVIFIMDVLGYNGKERKNIIRVAECYGIMLQIVNDNADFVPEKGTAAKNCKDALSDLKNRNITLPIIYHILIERRRKGNGSIQLFLETKDENYLRDNNAILKEIIQSGGLLRSMRVGREIAEIAKGFINLGNETAEYLLDMLNIAFNNRYYYHYYRAKKCYKKGRIYDFREYFSSRDKTNDIPGEAEGSMVVKQIESDTNNNGITGKKDEEKKNELCSWIGQRNYEESFINIC